MSVKELLPTPQASFLPLQVYFSFKTMSFSLEIFLLFISLSVKTTPDRMLKPKQQHSHTPLLQSILFSKELSCLEQQKMSQ